jgi:hypothetical protein
MPLGQKYVGVGVGNRKQRVAIITRSRCKGEGELLNKRQNNNETRVAAGEWGKQPEIFKYVLPGV